MTVFTPAVDRVTQDILFDPQTSGGLLICVPERLGDDQIDCRGLACPAPVIQSKECIDREHPGIIKITVDNEAAKQNVTRFLESQKYGVSVEKDGADFHITGSAGEEAGLPFPEEEASDEKTSKIMVMVATDRMGYGDDELGRKLMVSFLTTLKEMGEDLWRLVFVNNGVKMTIADSEVLPVLQELEKEGVYILVCGTCLTHFNLLEKKMVGETTNMLDIVTAMQFKKNTVLCSREETMPEDTDRSASGQTASPPPKKTPKAIRKEEIVLLILLIFSGIGVALTDFNPLRGFWFWVAMGPLFWAGCVFMEWPRAKAAGAGRMKMLWVQIIHWFGFLAAIYLVFLLNSTGRLNSADFGLVALLVLALSSFLAGVHGNWRISLVGVFLGIAAAGAALLEEYLWLILILAGIVFMLLAIILRRKRSA
ncbi:MAG: sulfurtransferase-like selenium metabolism protein YedF [Deltaproteobacteria bacterium]|nr:sulfurtransferase-like selenium metabolism protein YedF [Deltaproteobacteria bacterium]